MIVQHSRLLCPGGDGNIQSQRREKPYGKQNTRRIQTMTNKAKTYLKNIQEADTEKKLIGIEIAFKQDVTLTLDGRRLATQLYSTWRIWRWSPSNSNRKAKCSSSTLAFSASTPLPSSSSCMMSVRKLSGISAISRSPS